MIPKTGAGFGFKARATIIEKIVGFDRRSYGKETSEDEPRSLWKLNDVQLKESIRQNLEWLLNSRTQLTKEEFDREELTVMDYGIPDFATYAPKSVEDQKLLSRSIRRALTVFEPRLKDVTVYVLPEMKDEKSLRVIIIHAIMAEANIREPVVFKTILQY